MRLLLFKSAFISILIIVSSYSCKKGTSIDDDRIIGRWKLVEYISPPISDSLVGNIIEHDVIRGFEFFADGSCDNMIGYFAENAASGENIYLGTGTNYELKKDSLRVFNLATGMWDSHEVAHISNDTLILQSPDHTQETFIRSATVTNPDAKSPFDEIILSTLGCKSNCKIGDIIIRNDGYFFFNETGSNAKKGLYGEIMDTSYYNQIERRFLNIDIDKLKSSYTNEEESDGETIQILFIRDGKIYKSITDQGNSSPVELQWACRPIKYLHQQMTLQPFKSTAPYLKTEAITILKGKEILYLNKAESTYLKQLLSEAKELKIPFVKMYTLHVNGMDGYKYVVTTDGRYFDFGRKTYDIGQNFIHNNNLRSKFETKS